MAEPVINADQFIYITGLVIDGLEGGYYHPRMRANMKPSDQKIMGDSGETMFGLDRKHGAQLSKYPEWDQFWYIVDHAQPPYWKHYYRGGILEPKLKLLTAKIMYQWFTELAGKYLNADAVAAIANDDRLILHFSYAAWNGEGFFKKFAQAINKAKGGKEDIYRTAINARINYPNTVIRQQAKNMIALIEKHGLG
jgi:hypothetical protein